MWPQEQEERDFHCSTDSEWDRAEAYDLGARDHNQAWVLTDRDVWHANPFYFGPRVPHPESYDDEIDRDGDGGIEPDPVEDIDYEGSDRAECPF